MVLALLIGMPGITSTKALVLEDLISKGSVEATFKNKKIGFYIGSFDPLHKGHEALAKLPINKGLCDYVIVYPSWGGDGFKSRVDISIRQDMLYSVFADHPRVIVTRLPPQDIQDLLTIPTQEPPVGDKTFVKPAFEGMEFIGITGSDTALAYKGSEASQIFMRGIQIPTKYKNHTVGGIMALPTTSFIVGEREGDDLSSLTGVNAGRPIVAIVKDDATQKISSTAVKEAIASGASIEGMVSPSVVKIIESKGLYRGN
jgi:nicotinic acid mononucleotide adenylyltransferase